MSQKGYYTQWAGQFYVAAELTRRRYIVGFTFGNAAHTDMLVRTQSGKQFAVEVKSQQSHGFWIIARHELEADHFYVFVYLPKPEDGPPEFFVMTCADVQRLRQEYADRMTPGGKYRDDLGGFNWSDVLSFRDRWDLLPV